VQAFLLAHVRAPNVPEEPLQPIIVEQVKALLATCDARTRTGARDRAIILCLWDSGCRASEFTGLNVEDVAFEAGAVNTFTFQRPGFRSGISRRNQRGQ
jgi:integrase/recombinase XerD